MTFEDMESFDMYVPTGTGRYEGIQGSITYDGGYVTAYGEEEEEVGDSLVMYSATYTLEE